MTTIRAVLVDWAGTVTVPLREVVISAVLEAGLSEDELRQAFAGLADYVTGSDSPIHRAERGEITDAELLEWLDQHAAGARAVFDVAAPGSIFAAPDRAEMVALLETLRSHEARIVLATNNFASAHAVLERRYLSTGLVDGIVNSALIGARKPEPAFFDHCLAVAGVRAHEAVLVDDMEANIEAARARGLHGVLVGDDPAPAVAELRELLGP
jgi:putative hydrolase of the HAD superfamily